MCDAAGGASKYVCIYDVVERVMLRRFQISANKSLDGVLDQLNSKNITDAGPLDLIADAPSDDEDVLQPIKGMQQYWPSEQGVRGQSCRAAANMLGQVQVGLEPKVICQAREAGSALAFELEQWLCPRQAAALLQPRQRACCCTRPMKG